MKTLFLSGHVPCYKQKIIIRIVHVRTSTRLVSTIFAHYILLLFYTKTILKRRDPGLPENWESNPAMIGAVHGLIRGELTYARAELKKTVRDSYCILILYY